MADAVLRLFKESLPDEIARLAQDVIDQLVQGQYLQVLQTEDAQNLLGHTQHPKTASIRPEDFPSWNDYIFHTLGALTSDRTKPEKQSLFFCIGYAALLAFLQSNVTGPPLPAPSAQTVLPKDISSDKHKVWDLRKDLIVGLSVDGIAAYRLTPNVELLSLADAIMTAPAILKNVKGTRWAKMRISFMQQRLLSEVSSTLQNVIYDDLDLLADEILPSPDHPGLDVDSQVEFLLERATIHIHHGLDKFAKEDLEQVKKLRRFDFALTGLLGKRTKFQQNDISQLVVLARSAEDSASLPADNTIHEPSKPANLDLNDDTLLESISFTAPTSDSTQIRTDDAVPASLRDLDPSDQPQLSPLDSTMLLQFASSIKNTSPEDGLTREETLPYATRVLDGGSSNWQIYTQALLVRSRIEGYKARTVERGLLQLQALVDQVIADTASDEETALQHQSSANASFLPRPKESESASAPERLRYIFQLASPTRWELEAELAARWVQLGGLRSALDIYERLEMWAEAALCWAATEREDKARRVVRRQLFHQTDPSAGLLDSEAPEDEEWQGPERSPAPLEAPRLYCILGDIDSKPEMWEKAWEVSNKRYARAQRSLGRYYLAARDFLQAARAYSLSLKANQLNHTSWFAMGCALLEVDEFERAAEAFSRCVQLDDQDAESWSNLAAALLRIKPKEDENSKPVVQLLDDEDEEDVTATHANKRHSQQHKVDALKALKRAAALKHDSYRIWENVLIVAASISPPDWNAAMSAQRRIIELRGGKAGEKCLDKEILGMMARNVIASAEQFGPEQPGFARMFVKFMDQSVVPLITGSADLWQLVARLALWRNKPGSALDAEEKAWRAITAQPGWETDSEKRWNDVVESTIRLCDAYESLGPKPRTEGMGTGEPVMKDWTFKAKSAIRTVQGRGKATWEDTEGWERLNEAAEGLR